MNRKHDHRAFLTLMLILQTLFDKESVSEQKLDLYFEYLSDLSLSEIKQAVDAIVSTRRYSTFPSIAEIRESALGLRDAQVDEAALAAWNWANAALVAGRPVTDDPVLCEAIRLAFGGWGGFGETEPNNDFVKKRFLDCYKIAASKRLEAKPMLTDGDVGGGGNGGGGALTE